MFCYLWEYRVRPESVSTFLEHYGSGGTWAVFFTRSADYVGTRLLRDRNDPTRFLTIDTWTSAAGHAEFCGQFRSEFDALDARCEALTISEVHIGDFTEERQDE